VWEFESADQLSTFETSGAEEVRQLRDSLFDYRLDCSFIVLFNKSQASFW
jgi:hypothetical protein